MAEKSTKSTKGTTMFLSRGACLLLIRYEDGTGRRIIVDSAQEFEWNGELRLGYWPYMGEAPEDIPLAKIKSWTLWRPRWEDCQT